MAAFASMSAAERAAEAAVIAGTYIEAHVMRQEDGTIGYRGLQPVTSTGGGGWVEVTTA